jgi:hypothetical protein
MVEGLGQLMARLERRSIRLNQSDRKTAAQAFNFGPVFYPIMFQHDRKPV